MLRPTRTAIPIMLAAAVLACALSGCGGAGDAAPIRRQVPATVSPPIPQSPVAARGAVTYVPDCVGDLAARPAAIVLSCADANASVTEIAWTNWGAEVATGTGVAVINSCDPDCASGRLVRIDAEVRLEPRASHPHSGAGQRRRASRRGSTGDGGARTGAPPAHARGGSAGGVPARLRHRGGRA